MSIHGFPELIFLLVDDLAAVFPDAVFRNHTSDTAGWVDITVTANNRSRIKDTVASDFHMVTDHCSELLQSGFNVFGSVMNDYQFLVTLDIGGY